jgi:formate dehydrogenase major subunit
MYMLGENPFLSDPNVNKVRKGLAALEFLVVQDIFLTETTEFADVILPASTALEKTGTVTNTDRRVQVLRPALEPPGEAREDWRIICDLSTSFGLPMQYTSPEEVFSELRSLAPSLDGMDYGTLGEYGKLYPITPEFPDGKVVLFDDAFGTDDGRAHLKPAEWLPANELPDEEYPFVLSTGRLLEHWHTGSMTRRSFALDTIAPEAEVSIHPDDASRLGVAAGDFVVVRSRRGSVRIKVKVSDREARGACFIPFHFREAAANLLTNDAIDPFGKIPEYKFCAVRVEPA